uniref:ATP synthase complex subunit 8 n=1 Tax=Suinzona cyrtonoides TaxID=2856063 RepID=A0A8F5DNQ8_9CUCU|nr:ATP synthase F0 subunit 8 [Suinzona cyrtonoides]
MPQMMPLNWLFLFFFTINVFLMFNIINYFNYNYSIKNNNYSKNLIKYNWKW